MKKRAPRDITSINTPKIRIDLDPVQHQDKDRNIYVTLKDPLVLSKKRILIPPDLFYLLQFFDGRHSCSDLQQIYLTQFGQHLEKPRLIQMIKMLDHSLLLDNDRSAAKINRVKRRFAAQKIRNPACVGTSYPEDSDELEEMLKNYFARAKVNASIQKALERKTLKAMIAPHIDPRLGGHVYASAYDALHYADPADLYVILGVSHQPTRHLFALTTKDFQTPFGRVETDKKFVKNLLARLNLNYLKDELAHRNEHSIEFQTLFLKRQLDTPFKIVPILASFSHSRSKDEELQLENFISSLKAAVGEYTGKVCFIASVDFAHVGPLYGDAQKPDPYFLSRVERFDRNVLDSLGKGEVAALERVFTRSSNMYHICGYPVLRTLISVMPPAESHLLAYDNAIMDENRSTVIFASMVFI